MAKVEDIQWRSTEGDRLINSDMIAIADAQEIAKELNKNDIRAVATNVSLKTGQAIVDIDSDINIADLKKAFPGIKIMRLEKKPTTREIEGFQPTISLGAGFYQAFGIDYTSETGRTVLSAKQSVFKERNIPTKEINIGALNDEEVAQRTQHLLQTMRDDKSDIPKTISKRMHFLLARDFMLKKQKEKEDTPPSQKTKNTRRIPHGTI